MWSLDLFKKLHVFLKKIVYTCINVGKFGNDGSLVLKFETKVGANDCRNPTLRRV
jgi:hypothetical protein